jgi:hypothetical protein
MEQMALSTSNRMKKRACFFSLSLRLAICLVPGVLAVNAQELSKQVKIEHILDLMNAQATMDQTLDQMTAMINDQIKAQSSNATMEQLARAQEFQRKLMELVKSRLSWQKMRPDFIRIYGETYSDEELNGMLAFFESPAGQGFLKKTPMLTQKVIAVSQAQLGDLMPEIQRLARESFPTKQ